MSRLVVVLLPTLLLILLLLPWPAPYWGLDRLRPASWFHGLDFTLDLGEGRGVVGWEKRRGADQTPQDLGPSCSKPVKLRQIGK